jgi:hypothetical protein
VHKLSVDFNQYNRLLLPKHSVPWKTNERKSLHYRTWLRHCSGLTRCWQCMINWPLKFRNVGARRVSREHSFCQMHIYVTMYRYTEHFYWYGQVSEADCGMWWNVDAPLDIKVKPVQNAVALLLTSASEHIWYATTRENEKVKAFFFYLKSYVGITKSSPPPNKQCNKNMYLVFVIFSVVVILSHV